MSKFKIGKIIVFALLCSICGVAQGESENYWVVGSFSDMKAAIVEGERLSSATGVEVLLQPIETSGGKTYRLLVRLFTDEYDQLRLKSQLRFAGVAEVTQIEFSGNESELQSLFAVLDYSGEVVGSYESDASQAAIDVPVSEQKTQPMKPISVPEPFSESMVGSGAVNNLSYLVVASFGQKAAAENFSRGLETSVSDVSVKEAMVNGQVLYRVVSGPVDPKEEAVYKRQAVAAGIEGAWMLRGNVPPSDLSKGDGRREAAAAAIPEPELSEAIETAPTVVLTTMPSTGQAAQSSSQPVEAVQKMPAEDGYNLAELKDASSGFFLNKMP